ncbi:hypothetical protein O5553_27360 [Escherichia coli]|nr:hypothetical protein [Escherichia coli]
MAHSGKGVYRNKGACGAIPNDGPLPPGLISAFMTTAAANFATLTEREIAEAEQVTTINVKTGEQTA